MHANSTRAESKDLPVALPDFLELHPTLLTPLFGALAAGSPDHQRQTCGDDEVIERSRAFLNLVVGALLYTSDT